MDIHARTDRLARLLEERLDIRGAGFETLIQQRVPPGDGGVSLGQAVVASARLAQQFTT